MEHIVWCLVDGLPMELVRAYVDARPASKLAALWAHQRVRPLTPLAPNCQTPPSLFTIWSGRDVEQHRLVGYDVPSEVDGDPKAFRAAFETWPRDVDLVWDIYARQRASVRTCAVPFVQAESLSPWLLSATDVFRPPVMPPVVLGDGEMLSCEALGLAMRVEAAGNRLDLRDAEGVLRWSFEIGDARGESPLRLASAAGGDSHAALCLRGVMLGGHPKLVCLGYSPVAVHGSDAASRKSFGKWRPYVMANPGKLYAAGALGRRLNQGGQGEAERSLVDLMRSVHDSFAADIEWAIRAGGAELIVGYYPVIDLLCHQLLRYALTEDRQFQGPVAELLLEAVDWLDALVARLARQIAPHARLVVNSDHGMAPVEWDAHPNSFFAQRGWLRRGGDGSIDAGRSIVFFHPAENGTLAFHGGRLRGAGLTAAGVVDALAAEFRASGLPGLGALSGVPAPLGPEWQADMYLQAPPRVRLRAGFGNLVAPSPKGGDHTVHGPEPWLRGTLIDAGHARWLQPGPGELRLCDLLSAVTSVPNRQDACMLDVS